MRNETQLAISRTILDQIRVTDPLALACWAAQKFAVLPESKLDNGQYQLGGLAFDVSGYLFTGRVYVRLLASDVYQVDLMSKGGKLVESLPEVYCDELMTKIDHKVETKN